MGDVGRAPPPHDHDGAFLLLELCLDSKPRARARGRRCGRCQTSILIGWLLLVAWREYSHSLALHWLPLQVSELEPSLGQYLLTQLKVTKHVAEFHSWSRHVADVAVGV